MTITRYLIGRSLLTVVCLGALVAQLPAQVLFDNTKAETAGNADWIIDVNQPIPSPSITGINASTAENYWVGALSSWGVALAKLRNAGTIALPGNGLETLPASGRITYGDASNVQDLAHYKVFVVCEPNILFTAAEKTALLAFVQNGGGLFMVADHTGSDRNNDGADSTYVWNDFFTNNSVQLKPFGFTFNADSSTPTAIVDGTAGDPLITGLGGTVTTLKYDVGCTMNLTDNTVAHAAVWQSNPAQVMVLYGTFGAGRFVAIGDSSVVEDATSSQGTTYAGWTTPVDNGYCALNGTVWLLNAASTNNGLPTVTTTSASGLTTNSAFLNGSLNANGLITTATFEYGLTTNYGSSVVWPGNFSGSNAVVVSTNLTGLLAGTTYHFRLDATNSNGQALGADQSFTTLPSNNGGTGGTNSYAGVLAGWDCSALTGYGPSPFTPTTNAPLLGVAGLTRGSGVGTGGTAAARGWGGTTFNSGTEAAAVAANQFASFGFTNVPGYKLSITAVSKLIYRRSSSGPPNGVLQYQVGNTAFADITNFAYTSTASSGTSLGSYDLTGIAGLQNISAATNVTFRIVNYGASGAAGTWYLFDPSTPGTTDFEITGTLAPLNPPVAFTNQFLTAYDAGAGFVSGENLILTNTSGLSLYVWSAANPALAVTNWALEQMLNEQPLHDGTQRSYYSVNLSPVVSPMYYIFASTNIGPFAATEAVTRMTTADFAVFNLLSTNVAMSAEGIFALATPPAILAAPASTNIFAGKNLSLGVTAAGSGTLAYQWQFNNNPLTDGGSYAGTHTNLLTLTAASTNQTGSYAVVVTNLLGSVTSSPAFVGVLPLPTLAVSNAAAGFAVSADGGAAGSTYIIQHSANLLAPIAWDSVQTNLIGPNGQIRYQATNRISPAGYYRVKIP